MIVAFRRHTLLPLDDCLYALQPTIPHLTRSSLDCCLQRHGVLQAAPGRRRGLAQAEVQGLSDGHFYIHIAEVRTAEGKPRSVAHPQDLEVRLSSIFAEYGLAALSS